MRTHRTPDFQTGDSVTHSRDVPDAVQWRLYADWLMSWHILQSPNRHIPVHATGLYLWSKQLRSPALEKNPMTLAKAARNREAQSDLDAELRKPNTWHDDVAAAFLGLPLASQPIGNAQFEKLKIRGAELIVEARTKHALGLHLFLALKTHGAPYLAKAPFMKDYEAFCRFFEIPLLSPPSGVAPVGRSLASARSDTIT